jgi:hypothetical protein
MERLRDQIESADGTIARAAALLAAVPPIDPKRLRRSSAAVVLPLSRRPVASRLRVAMVATLTFGSLAAAAATAHRMGFGTGSRDVTPSTTPAALPAQDGPSAARPSRGHPSDPVARPGVLAPETQVQSAGSRRSAPEAAREPAPVVSGSSAESILIVQAVRALRRDGDPARARALAEEALRRHPKGSQVEEAMVIAMQAAVAEGDDPGARRAADRYLERFPSGRFADQARHVLGTQ